MTPLVCGLNAVKLSAGDFKNAQGEGLRNWDEITELFFSPSNRIESRLKTDEDWKGEPPALKNLRWAGE